VTHGGLHHVELWVPDLAAATRSWGWLLGELGWTPHDAIFRGVTGLELVTRL
jgi:catechol 2,3-dioxygenase-like lactoylglutathione lyase family enzyme